MNLGRNDRCFCGSGKKYKNCCLRDHQPDQNQLKKVRWARVQNVLINKLMQHVVQVYGPEAIHEAYNEFQLFKAVEGFDPESPELPIFVPWFFYSWYPDSDFLEGVPEVSPAISLLNFGLGLTDEEKVYLRACCKTAFSFFEALEVVPGQSIQLKDILTEELCRVFEFKGTEGLQKGDIFFGKVIEVDGIGLIEACSPILFQPMMKMQIMELRKKIQKTYKMIDQTVLEEYGFEVLELYRELYDSLTNPRQPILTNTDGDLMVPHQLTFEIKSPDEMFESLHDLSFQASKQELLDDAQVDQSGKIKSIEFPWLKKGNKQNKSWDNTVYGRIKIAGRKMTVEVNSKERSDLFIKTLKKKSPEGWKLKSTVVKPLDSRTQSKKISKARLEEMEKEQEELMAMPEVRAQMENMMKAHWDNWLTTPMPALAGLRPVDAVKSKDGRELLESLLTQFERDAEARPLVGQTPETFKALRARLGL